MTKIIKPIQSFLKISEAIIYEDKLHFIELLFSFIYTSIGLAIGIWLCKYIEPNYVGYGVIFFVIVLEIYFLITYFTTSIVITNSRVFKKYGKQMQKISLSNELKKDTKDLN